MPDRSTTKRPQTDGRVIRHARWYDLLGKKMSGGRDTLVSLAAPGPGENVLDVGCGTGDVALALASRVSGGKAVGIDASPEMIEVAQGKAAKAGSDVEFRVAVVESLPFPDDSFDLVTSSLMLHHLPTDLERAALGEVRRVLKPGGRLVVADFASESHSPLGHLLSVIGHGRGAATIDTLAPMLREAGFDRVDPVPTPHRNLVFVCAR